MHCIIEMPNGETRDLDFGRVPVAGEIIHANIPPAGGNAADKQFHQWRVVGVRWEADPVYFDRAPEARAWITVEDLTA